VTTTNPNANLSYPLVLTGDVTLASPNAPATDTPIGIVDPVKLTPVENDPFFIDEVIITYETDAVQVVGEDNPSPHFGGDFFLNLKLGGRKVTQGFVPIWNFGIPYDEYPSEFYQGIQGRKCVGHYRWIPPKPIFVPEGMTMEAEFMIGPNFYIPDGGWFFGGGPPNYVCRVSYRGRTIPCGAMLPEETILPYVMSYVARDGERMSRETDLRNDIDKGLVLHRIVGRSRRQVTGRPVLRDYVGDGLSGNSYLDSPVLNLNDVQKKVRIYAPGDERREITNGMTKLGLIFPPQTRCITLGRMPMKPGERFIVENETAPYCPVAPAPGVFMWQPMISAIGSRPERIG
jgi:hypothetical protein